MLTMSTESQSPRVLQIPRSDEQESHVLLQVSRPRSAALDLDIAATEGENPYTGFVRQAHLGNLRAKNYQGSDDEWAHIVSYIFGYYSTSANKPDWSTGIEVSASIPSPGGDEDREIVLTIRKRIQAITQRLGSITLKQDDEQAIELFDWASIAISKCDGLEQQLSSLTERYRVAEDTIQQLSRQLEDLIRAKSQHENQLVANFAQLLNEKKLKIRNQQRLLASAKVDPTKVSEIQAATTNRDSRTAQKTRRSKRDTRDVSDDDSESDAGFEKMEVDQVAAWNRQEDQETDDGQHSTPQPLEEEGDGSTTDEESVPSPTKKEKVTSDVQGPSINHPLTKESAAPPPRRELPFVRRVPGKEGTQTQPGEGAESTAGETDDDEL